MCVMLNPTEFLNENLIERGNFVQKGRLDSSDGHLVNIVMISLVLSVLST